MDANKLIYAFAKEAEAQGMRPGDDDSVAIAVTMLATLLVMRTMGDEAKTEELLDAVHTGLAVAVGAMAARVREEVGAEKRTLQ